MLPDEQLKLLRRFAPTLHFDALERWRPGTVAGYLEHSTLLDGQDRALAGTPPAEAAMRAQEADLKARLDPLPGGPERNSQKRSDELLAAYGSDLDLDGAGTAYGRVVSVSDAVFLQYWLFYADNPCVLAPGRHDGDWELIQIRLKRRGGDFAATQLTLAEHGKPVSRRLAQGEVGVYIAIDSHACYFEEGAKPLIPLSDVCEPAGDTGTAPRVVLLPIEASKRDWAHWSGRWGVDRGPGTWLALRLHLKRTPSPLKRLNEVGAGESPPSPAHQGQSWHSPRAFAARGTARRGTASAVQRLAHLLGRLTWPRTPPRIRVTAAGSGAYAVSAESAGRFLRRVSFVSVAFAEERPNGRRRPLGMRSVRTGEPVTIEIEHEGRLVWRAAGYNLLRQRGRPVQ